MSASEAREQPKDEYPDPGELHRDAVDAKPVECDWREAAEGAVRAIEE